MVYTNVVSVCKACEYVVCGSIEILTTPLRAINSIDIARNMSQPWSPVLVGIYWSQIMASVESGGTPGVYRLLYWLYFLSNGEMKKRVVRYCLRVRYWEEWHLFQLSRSRFCGVIKRLSRLIVTSITWSAGERAKRAISFSYKRITKWKFVYVWPCDRDSDQTHI